MDGVKWPEPVHEHSADRRGCCDAAERTPSPTGDIEHDGIIPLFLMFQEVVQCGLAGVFVAVNEQLPQPRAGIHQPAAEQSTH